MKFNYGEFAIIKSQACWSLTDIARFKDPESTGIVIAHWLSTKYTIQFIGAWEQLHKPNFNVTEFSNIKNEADNSMIKKLE